MGETLSGIKVLDLTRVLAGPLCTMVLGDLGAEVIKIEAPNGSDDTRNWGPPFKNGVSAYYLCANRNKKSLTVDLKSEKGKEIIRKLVKECDVLIHNFKTGTMERLGLDFENLSKINNELVYCSITGFGETGPYKDLAGYDYIIQAMCGLMSITGDSDSGPQKVGVAITDILTGLYACIGIQAALLERKTSGTGQKLDISLFDAGVSSLVNIASNYLMSGKIPGLLGNSHANIVPYQTFDTANGKMVIAVGNDRQFEKFVKMIGQEELSKNPLFSSNAKRVENREQLVPILQQVLSEKPTEFWQALCNENGIPSGPINNLEQVFQNEQVLAREMVVEKEHPQAGKMKLVGSPLKLSKTPIQIKHHPPIAGEHTEEILNSIGYSIEEIRELKNNKIV
ncbi:CoA transferase [Heyndrickxia sporothermodurans]|uniref:CaiB/BaiF CoA transferase family protein n=1 Tax=Heyndrickxia sporothermodurans TaxID=46224 RepID=UPI000D33E7F8|nr:CaiB/BaiF CoA-transferase family protein [Heyndrickxia sporothermodurans]PTY78518.1 CoA transferase [Heyndrickxia sporothermodurans]